MTTQPNDDNLVGDGGLVGELYETPAVNLGRVNDLIAEPDDVSVGGWRTPADRVRLTVAYHDAQFYGRWFRYKDASTNLTPTIRESQLTVSENPIPPIRHNLPT